MARYEYPSLRQGLVGAWCPSLGASGLSLIDRSGRNGHATLNNMAGQDNWQASGSGVSLAFDGVNDNVTAVNRLGLLGNALYSCSVWAQVPSGVSGALVWDGIPSATPTSLALRVASGGGLSISAGSTGCTVNGGFVAGAWTHFTLVYPGTVIRDMLLYSNGRYLGAVTETNGAGSANVAVNWLSSTVPTIGTLGTGGSFANFRGQIDDVRIYNRVLTPAEIRLLASRRGIGLSPLPDRAAGLPRKMSVINGAGVRKEGDLYVRTATEWKLGIPGVNTGAGGWK